MLFVAAAAWTALAAWLSFGAIAVNGARLGILPVDPVHLALAAFAAVAVLAIGLGAARATPQIAPPPRMSSLAIAVAPLGLLFLPWLPFPVPAAFLLWTGPWVSIVWITVTIGLLRVAARGWHLTFVGSPRHSVVAAATLAFLIFSIASWRTAAARPAGDEPHYLVMTQSLLYDHDLKIENNHARGDYHAYFAGDLRPDSQRRGTDGQLYSIHAPGVSVLVLPAFAIAGYHGVVLFLILLSASACALAWWLAWRVTGNAGAAWFGWATVVLSVPFLFESFAVYPDGPAAALVLTGFWALLRAEWERNEAAVTRPLAAGWTDHPTPAEQGGSASWVPWMLHGAALAALPWMHTRFAVLAATLGGLVLLRLAQAPHPMIKAIAFLSAPAVSALAWLSFFVILYGVPDPSAPYGARLPASSFAFLPDGIGGVLFDQGFGLFATAPILAIAIMGFARIRRLALDWAVVAVPYGVAVTTFAIWWADASGPARFFVPLLLPLAIPSACGWAAASSRGMRAVMVSVLLLSGWLSGVMVFGDGGRLGYHTRNDTGTTVAPWLEWANPVLDLTSAAPAFVPLPIPADARVARANAARSGFEATLAWVVCLGGAALVLLWLIERVTRPEAVIAVTTVTLACAVMIAASIVWTVQGADPLTPIPAQMNTLRLLDTARAAAFDLAGLRHLTPAEAWNMRLDVPVRRVTGRPATRFGRALATFPSMPAGSYRLSVARHGNGEGWMMVGVGKDQFAILTEPIATFDGGTTIDLPVDVGVLTVRADERAREELDLIELRPLGPATGHVPGGAARHAVRYGRTVVFFMDDAAFPEPTGFWVGGGRETEVVVAGGVTGAIQAIALRNGATGNEVTLEAGGWRQVVTLGPGEERAVNVPRGSSHGSADIRIRSSTGFRPSDVDSKSRDARLLGVFVKVVE